MLWVVAAAGLLPEAFREAAGAKVAAGAGISAAAMIGLQAILL